MRVIIMIMIALILMNTAYASDIFRFSGNIDSEIKLPIIKDADKDNVIDSKDKCALTPLNAKVDLNGCSASQFCDLTKVRFNFVKKGNKIIINSADYYKCLKADWKDNEKALYPLDCEAVIMKQTAYCRNTARVN